MAGSGPLARSAASFRRRVPPEQRRRLAVASGGYAVLAVFGLSLWLARGVGGRSWGGALAIAGVVAAPLALALVYERLTALKTPWFEISLTAATVEEGSALAQAVTEQQLSASGSPALTEALSAMLSPGAATVLRVNLRSGTYWWSTRLFLLAALTDDFARVERFAFVEGGAARRYVGLAEPRAVRTALAARFPDYARVYASMRESAPPEPQYAIVNIVGSWQWKLSQDVPLPAGATTETEGPAAHEEALKVFVTATELNDWLSGVLDTDRVTWDGWSQDPQLRAKILSRDTDYVALVQDGRLDRVVSRDALALAVARSAVRIDQPDSAP